MIHIAIESWVYAISKKDFVEARIHLDNQIGTDEWALGLDIIRNKGKFLYILDGNYNY